MNMKERRQAWVDALRSGDYQQGKHQLQSRDGYCCLGVACVVYENATGQALNKGGGLLYGEMCPPEVQEWLGLSTDYGAIAGQPALTTGNDHGATFQQIADIIDDEPAGLFVD